MMRALFLTVLVAFDSLTTVSALAQEQEHALAVELEVQRLADQRELWPGFDPLSIPLAIFTGGRTYLFRHPAPPNGFAPVEGAEPAAFAAAGRHASVTANTSAEIGGIVTATLMAAEPRQRSSAEQAAIALHEAFHVYQRQQHPGWAGNEGDLFLYPTDDAQLLGLRRRESAALRRALQTADAAGAACWARLALGFRRERFAGMETAFPTYERLTELNEGLATYVQLIATGKTTVEIPEDEFRAADVRERIYAVGPALAFLLDRLRPGWQAALETDDTQTLDQLLEVAVARDDADACTLTPDETARIDRIAESDVAGVVAGRTEHRRQFEALTGWRVVVEAAEAQPLWPQGFDPLNIEGVDGGFLHTRFVRLENDAGQLQALDESAADIEALTVGVGPHPLFNGVRQVTIAGLAEPEVEEREGRVTVRAPGFTAEFMDASAEVSGTQVFVRLRSPP